MKYSQMTTRRLSRAAAKLLMDDTWHEFETSPNTWYRVRNKKIMQKVSFENAAEEVMLLPLIRDFEPLEKLRLEGGFREELNFTLIDDRIYLTLPIRFVDSNEILPKRTATLHFDVAQNVLRAHTIISGFSQEQIEKALEILLRVTP